MRSYCRELSVRGRFSTAPLDSLASTWVGPKVLGAQACPEVPERKAVLVAAGNALAAPVVAGEPSLAAVVVRAAARVVEAHSAAGAADVFCASR